MNNRVLAIDLFIIWAILAPIVLIICTFWLDDRINKLQKELYDIRDTIGKRISNDRQDFENDITTLTDGQEDICSELDALSDEVHSLQMATNNDPETNYNFPQMFYTKDNIFDDEDFDEKVHEAIDSIDQTFDEVMTDGSD